MSKAKRFFFVCFFSLLHECIFNVISSSWTFSLFCTPEPFCFRRRWWQRCGRQAAASAWSGLGAETKPAVCGRLVQPQGEVLQVTRLWITFQEMCHCYTWRAFYSGCISNFVLECFAEFTRETFSISKMSHLLPFLLLNLKFICDAAHGIEAAPEL